MGIQKRRQKKPDKDRQARKGTQSPKGEADRVRRRGEMWVKRLLPRLLASKEAAAGSFVGVNTESGRVVVAESSLDAGLKLERLRTDPNDIGWIHEVTPDDIKNRRMG